MAALEAQRHPKSIICEVTFPATTAPILMHISSPRNNPLLEQNHGSARVQHVDPLGPAPGCRDESCARDNARAQGESLPAADSARSYLRCPQLCTPHQRSLEVFWAYPQA